MAKITLTELRRQLVQSRIDPTDDCTLVDAGDTGAEWDDDCGCEACVEERVYRSPVID